MAAVKKAVKEEEEYKMKITILEKTEQNLIFELTEADHSYANALRRIMISEVPTLAVDEVNFFANDSALYDEIVAHRIGLNPLTTDLSFYNFKKDCKCKGVGCPLCQVTLTLKAEGPKTVYAEELEAPDENVKSVFPKMPIIKLIGAQKIKLEAIAILGIGKDHAKHTPGIISYKNKPVLKIDNAHKQFNKFKDNFPKQAFVDGKLNKEALLKNNLYEACGNINKEILSVGYEKNTFIFNIESFGQLAPEIILKTAIEKLNSKLDDFTKSLKKSKKI
jgi:DNA-directed RNA polymerase subunit D